MSLIKRMLSSVGIGAAKVDTILETDTFAPGDSVEAVVKIIGGRTEQQIDGLYFSINSTYKAEVEVDDGEGEEGEMDVTKIAVLDKFKLSDAFVIGPGEEKEIPLSFQLPLDTPLTLGKTKVWIKTGLDIKKAIDPGDKDYIKVVPGNLAGPLFDALNGLGFQLVNADCEAVSSGFWKRSRPFVQEFEFKPFGGPFQGKLDELEIVFFPGEDAMEVLMEIDRKARGIKGFFAEMMDMDETKMRFTFGPEDVPDLADKLHEMIDSQI